MCVSVINLDEFRLVNVVANLLGDVFPELKQQEVHIRNVIQEEEESFGRTLVKVRIDIYEDVFMGCHFLVSVTQ
jgi:alanyl-tRNA synthetase